MTMKTPTILSYATCVALSINVAACATSADEPEPTPDAAFDAAPRGDTLVADTTVKDAASDTRPDTAVVDSAKDTRPPDTDACTPGATETRTCGACGSQSRFCLSEGYFTSWTTCTGERADVECKIGEKRSTDCGNCGKAVDFCDTKTCAWISGLCAGEGPCAPGDVETTKASCSVVDEVRTRTCDDKCAWSTFSACGLPRGWLPMAGGPLTARIWSAVAWTGSKMIVWGGDGSSNKGDGATYDLASNTWTMLPATPTGFAARRNPMGVWTGSKMIIWGGRDYSTSYKDGVVYDPAGAGGAGSWTTMATSPLTSRFWSAAVWSTTTNELLVWGGCTGWSGLPCTSVTGDGAAYNPATNTWTALPAAPISARGDTAFGWDGSEMIIAGGNNAAGPLLDGARFDPVARSWVKFSEPPAATYDARRDEAIAFDGTSLFMFGGRATTTASTAKNNGAYYTPEVGWTAIPVASDVVFPSGAKRYNSASWFGAGKLFVYSGQGTSSSSSSIGGFASYDPATSSWTPLDETGAPAPRGRAIAVWTGREAIVWGGSTSDYLSGYVATGGIYRP
jgi:N-acetylneuraminic acid mutarotase